MADLGLPRNSLTSFSRTCWTKSCILYLSQFPSVSHSGLDSDVVPVVCFLMGGVSPLLGFSPIRFYEEVASPDSFTNELRIPR